MQVLVNKHLEKYNVELIRTYTLVDKRFKKLALILKYWNKMHIENSTQRLSSHAMVLMLICYLQIRGVLPKLQLMNVPETPPIFNFMKVTYKKNSDHLTSVEGQQIFPLNVWFEKDLAKIREDRESTDNLSLAELFIGFFDFYTNYYDPKVHVVSSCFP